MHGEGTLEDAVVKVFRNAKVVKGGRRFSFAALVVVGDRNGTVGYGYAKANEVPPSVEKAIKDAKKNLKKITIVNDTLPHTVHGKCRATDVVMLPASPGTGVIAPAFSFTSSKSTSPTVFLFFVTGSSTKVEPKSITITPSLTISAVMNFGLFTETTSTSAR